MGNRREPMTREHRAKQFMPFDALKGFREALAEKERIRVPRRELSDGEKEELDRILKGVQKKDILTVKYYQQGEYVQLTGMVSAIDTNGKSLTVVNEIIPFDDISDLIIQHNHAHKENEGVHTLP